MAGNDNGAAPPNMQADADASPVETPAAAATASDSQTLSVAIGIIGLIAASSQTFNDLTDLNEDPAGRTAALERAVKMLKSFKLTIQLLYKFLRRFELNMLQLTERALLVDIDILTAVLTESVLAVSELGNQLVDIVRQAEELGTSPKMVCPTYGESIRRDADRIFVVDGVIMKLVSVLQVQNELEALRFRAQAEETVKGMLDTNAPLASRMNQIEDIFGARALVPRGRLNEIAAIQAPPSYIYSSGGADELPDYAAATGTNRPTSTSSVEFNPGSWSIFSGLTITDVKILSLMPLPLTAGELRYGSFYTADFTSSVNDALGELAEMNTRYKGKRLATILGLRVVGEPVDEDAKFARCFTAKPGLGTHGIRQALNTATTTASATGYGMGAHS